MTDPDFLQVPPMKVLETDRLRLRTVRVSDAVAVMPIITDETTMLFTSGVVPNDLDVAERWLSARALGKDVLNFAITLKKDGPEEKGEEEIVGIMGSYHMPEIGYLMHPGELSIVPLSDFLFFASAGILVLLLLLLSDAHRTLGLIGSHHLFRAPKTTGQ